MNTLKPYQEFAKRVDEIRCDFLEFIKAAQAQGKTVAALGPSTKGNVLLQYCGINAKEVKFVGEVNSDKFGCHTPGTWTPIIPEQELLSKKLDYLIVLPWHFRKFFIEKNFQE